MNEISTPLIVHHCFMFISGSHFLWWCAVDVTPKTQCSKEKVCVSGSTKCGNSVCSVDEKCGVADSCKPDLEKIKASVKAGGKWRISRIGCTLGPPLFFSALHCLRATVVKLRSFK